MANGLRATLPQILLESVKSSHIEVLRTPLSPEAKVERYRNLEFFVEEVSEENLILGDSLVLFLVEGERSYKPFLDKGDNLNGVFLPLSPKKVLVGKRKGVNVSAVNLPKEIARSSLEYFIADRKSNEFEVLKEFIGLEANFLTKFELENIVKEILITNFND